MSWTRLSCTGLSCCWRAMGVSALLAGAALLAAPAALAGWRVQSVPEPHYPRTWLNGVSCTSRRMCIAVGDADGLKNYPGQVVVAERWNGRRWSIQQMPRLPAPAPGVQRYSELDAVSCVSSRFCMAVGGNVGGDGRQSALAELWNGHNWSVEPVPQPFGLESRLSSVSCTSSVGCVAISPSVTERWNGISWSVVESAEGGALASLSCMSMALCIGAGSSDLANGASVPGSARWEGTGWQALRTPYRGPRHYGDDSVFDSVSCSPMGSCMAVGSSQVGLLRWVGLAERWNGMRWAIQPTARYRDAWDTELTGVSCPTRDMCAADGYNYRNHGTDQAVLEVWNGTVWVSQPVPIHPGVGGHGAQYLQAMSCISRELCTAVGTWVGRGFPVHPLIVRTTDALPGNRQVGPPPFTG